MLLRVPDEIHRRLSERAAQSGRSVNALATEILDAAVDTNDTDRRSRLRARAKALGVMSATPAAELTPARRRRIIATTRGLGPLLDHLLDEERARP